MKITPFLMKISHFILIACAIILSAATTHAVTLTTITNPPSGGTVSGAGTYTAGAQIYAGAQAVNGWYVSDFTITPYGPGLNDFQRIQMLAGLSGSDITAITSPGETLTLNSDTTVSVTFASAASTITEQPTGQTVVANGNVTLTAGAFGRRPLSYQWRKNGLVMPGVTNLNLALNGVQTTNSAEYTLVVSNIFGVVTSTPAMLLVKDFLVSVNGTPMTNSAVTVGGNGLINLQSRYSNGTIFYTTDGTEPDFSATPYSSQFYIYSTCTLRAIAYSSDLSASVLSDPLTVTVIPVYYLSTSTGGGGTVILEPPASPYTNNTAVTVIAQPDPGWTFMGWSGALSGNDPTNIIIMDQDKSVSAMFGTTLGTTTVGNGTVSVFPVFPLYPYGCTLDLTATPGTSNYFGLWGNAASGNQNPLSYTVTSSNPTISALFAALPTNQAALTILSEGGGVVEVTPFANKYQIGSTNALTAHPDWNQQFLGWSGDVTGNQNPLSLVMNTSKVVTAHFSRTPFMNMENYGSSLEFWIWGTPKYVYQIEASTNLAMWTPVFSATNYFGEAMHFSDPSIQYLPYRMYRAVSP